ncbi:MAG: hypothetical protein C0504_12470 [Candidatus Solibacter sp.]|nr:hypothetical protein [Candidatus Solibacter sp.]
MREKLETDFEFTALGTDWRAEVLAGFTTFVTMAYILFVNPSIHAGGMMGAAGSFSATLLEGAKMTV